MLVNDFTSYAQNLLDSGSAQNGLQAMFRTASQLDMQMVSEPPDGVSRIYQLRDGTQVTMILAARGRQAISVFRGQSLSLLGMGFDMQPRR